MVKKYDIVGAIFCGGKSRKMDEFLSNGLTRIETLVNTLMPFCREIVFVGQIKHIPDSFSHLKIIPNNYDHCGTIGAFEALLNSGLADEYLTAPGDLDKPDPKIFEALMSYGGSYPVVVRYKNKIQPLMGRYPAFLKTLTTQYIAYDNLSMDDFLAT